MQKELLPYWNLSVTVLRGKISSSRDLFSKCDCYILLKLPTACACCHRTKTVRNNKTPEWNETFLFRVHSGVKNILELYIYDDDRFTRDDCCSAFLFDISNLTLGQNLKKCFISDDKKSNELWVEFNMTKSSESPKPYFSNGVLMAGPFCALDVKADTIRSNVNNLLLKLRGAFKEDCLISGSEEIPSLSQTMHYYINRDLETEFSIMPSQDVTEVDGANVNALKPLSSIPMKQIPAKKQFKLSLPVKEGTVDLQVNQEDRSNEDMNVRLGFDIPMEESQFLVKRRKVVSQALQRALKLTSPPEPSKVPVVAVVCSGGGSRAMTGTYGSLRGLQKLQLLDAVTYITGVSGSTWTLASLYGDADWSSSDLNVTMESVKKEISKSVFSLFSLEQLRDYREKMKEKEKQGHLVSLIDMWGLAVEYLIVGKKSMVTLSEQQKALLKGQNPLPIYTALNMKNGKTGSTVESEWCEFTPYEVGFLKYGAFIPAQNFGSEYYLGHLVRKLPEIGVFTQLGIWSSVFSLSLTQIWSTVTGVIPSWAHKIGEDVKQTDTDDKASTLDTLHISPMTEMAKKISNFLTSRPIISQANNFLRGFQMHRNYSENSDFTALEETHPDAFPNSLTPADTTVGLIDSAVVIKSGFPPVLRPKRRADVILSLNYAWDVDHFKPLKQAHKYCSDRKIPFPRIDFKKLESEPMKEVYVFEDKENPEAPIVLHFPLINITFKQFKAPGVKREGKTEMKDGDFDIDYTSSSSPFATSRLTYAPEDFQKLADLTTYNIVNNKDIILNTLNKAMKKNMEGTSVHTQMTQSCVSFNKSF
ncbi:Cytosolic phospholipase A2 delta [Triplophysa tibetana]|uniref:Phospholipase A2 n=1 Tax=Triplophysa tibetana TaxID=1572043 RepID=A0A5A9NM21_9TELE|nr:Cytosolic phospholipase A2 delta [Triplophysa tibetana]